MNEFACSRSIALVGAVIVGLCACRKESPAAGPRELDPAGKSVVLDSMSKSVDLQALETMGWQDIGPTTEACVRYQLAEETLKTSITLTAAPVVYLRGLLKFAREDRAGAADEWGKIELASIPPDFLYAPWRLAEAGPATRGDNRYLAPLAAAVVENRTSPLVRARFQAGHGQWREALEAYLLSDPADWTPSDGRIFSGMKLQAPCRHDVEVLMAGALKGGRVPQSLRVELAQLIKTAPLPDTEALSERLRTDPVLAKAATEGAARALDLRQSFASNRFAEVLERVARIDPLQATDEAVMLAFLAAVRLKDPSMTERWADEFLRRNPNPKTRQWIASIRGLTL